MKQQIGSTPEVIEQAHVIRYEVFVDEQQIPLELDLDGKDQRSVHALLKDGEQLVATARLTIDEDQQATLARVAVTKPFRGRGIASDVVTLMMNYAQVHGVQSISIHAHEYLRAFYEGFGFDFVADSEQVGEHRLIEMKCTLNDTAKDDHFFMRQALEISKKALPDCEPNPPVGCVLVKDGEVVSQGFTRAIGGNHAEVEALNAYKGEMEGVTAYVTLEPCAFVGRTPSCARTFVSVGIERVVVAMLDPDPRNNGRGIEILTQGGVSVEVGVEQDAVSAFLTPYLGKS